MLKKSSDERISCLFAPLEIRSVAATHVGNFCPTDHVGYPHISMVFGQAFRI
ncbi:hypothetical protein BJY00DRAFT_273999 [Aspergillus carlsbadensis]|nr:hypothetical protein BJY00DRAFT_273999 [Aspergillus carlsbadensis]